MTSAQGALPSPFLGPLSPPKPGLNSLPNSSEDLKTVFSWQGRWMGLPCVLAPPAPSKAD